MKLESITDALRVIRRVKNWPTYAKDFFGLTRPGHLRLTLRNGPRITMRSGSADRAIFNEVWIHKIYTPRGFDISEQDYVVDIGAHIGMFSLYASAFATRGIVYAFEPAPENYEILKENIGLNGATNIISFKAALTDQSGEREFLLSQHNTGWNSFYDTPTWPVRINASDKKHIVVPTLSLEQVVNEQNVPQIDLLKMDCEGAEYDILFGCPRRVLKLIRKISMEWHYLDESRNVHFLKEFLSHAGFEVQLNSGMLYAKAR